MDDDYHRQALLSDLRRAIKALEWLPILIMLDVARDLFRPTKGEEILLMQCLEMLKTWERRAATPGGEAIEEL